MARTVSRSQVKQKRKNRGKDPQAQPQSDNSIGTLGPKKQKLEKNALQIIFGNEHYRGRVRFIEIKQPTCNSRDPVFECNIEIDGKIYSEARVTGFNKEIAKREAAELALQQLDLILKREEYKKAVEVIKLAGLIQLSNETSDTNIHSNNEFYCSVCLKTIVCEMGSDCIEILRNHVLHESNCLVHLTKMVDLNSDDWDEVMKVLQGSEKKNKFPRYLQLGKKTYKADLKFVRHVIANKFFCIACQNNILIKGMRHFKQHILSKEHKVLVQELIHLSYEQLKVKQLEKEANAFELELLQLSTS